ncbi:hypothetical protein [Candidatus Solirubrobacter pratensis]|uniref:hypothetical protein n=1 Tax=Candidatus Solirubrobacter pratensis TaxID=1298857 RepID=UPI0004092E4D|nr:hypothetical protein [Candidatus Solirubrobacter pratensis]
MTAARRTVAPEHRLVTFIQYDQPALKDGEYEITAAQGTNQVAPKTPDTFSVTRRFAVAGERFSLDPSELAAVFPPDLAVGELDGDLPHVLFNRRTLPWERTATPDPSAPWLAVLLFDEAQAPAPHKRTAKDLIAAGTPITAAGSTVTGIGTLPAGIVSYPSINPLDYGETPDDACMTIDVDAALFSAIAPAAADLPYLAHIRETDTVDAHDTTTEVSSPAVVLGNRVPARGGTRAHAYLVSLENMAPLLPDAQGNPAPGLAGASTVRLLTYRWWSFTATDGDATFQALLEGVNAVPPGQAGPLSSLQLPYLGARPTPGQVQQAMNDLQAGSVTAADAAILAHNAFGLGYVPLAHRLRHGGETVSWYRGPLAPLPVSATVQTPISCPDAATRYDPSTGMFDISYAAAWQLGLLLGLQSRSFGTALYNWRRGLRAHAVVRTEQARYEQLLGGAFESVLGARAARLADLEPVPPAPVVRWLARLALLDGVPFNYLVPDEGMLPPESLRMFHLDRAWIDALIDGASSIGRATAGEPLPEALLGLVDAERREVRPNPAPAVALHENATGEVTGFLLRSAAVAGWPNAAASAYADSERLQPLKVLRSVRLGTDVMLCLFDGVADVVAVHEPAGQLHCGVEGVSGSFTTTLREVVGTAPGHQYDPPQGEAAVLTRADARTLQVAATATSIEDTLNTRFGQKLTLFTSAEFALEMVKGVVEVEFRQGG